MMAEHEYHFSSLQLYGSPNTPGDITTGKLLPPSASFPQFLFRLITIHDVSVLNEEELPDRNVNNLIILLHSNPSSGAPDKQTTRKAAV